jgi:hypothetical protein
VPYLPQYNPPRQKTPRPTGDPLEIDLVFNVRSCGTCAFFWPDDPGQQPYGPYPAFDLDLSQPIPPDPASGSPASFPWIKSTTRPECFPDPGILHGCRKAPVMTLGINPNLTAFAPGQAGGSWAYPSFASDGGGDEWAKYAYYYRYRTVYQERFDLGFVQRFLLPEPRVVAPRPGQVVSADRPTSSPSFDLKLRYDGDLTDTVIPLQDELGKPRWVVLFDPHTPNNHFAAGDVVAGQLDVPPGQPVAVHREQQGYYERFMPVLEGFQALLRAQGHPNAQLRMGEDVCQLDMVACASPHWNPGFLGGTDESEQTIITDCVAKNAWAMKQLVQTQPAVLYLVSEVSYGMFRASFGALIERDPPLSDNPADGVYTLLAETTDRAHPCTFRFDTTIDGRPYSLRTRLVVTPHFSYSTNFMLQFRLSPERWQALQTSDPACAQFLKSDKRLIYQPSLQATDYAAFLVQEDVAGVFSDLESKYPASAAELTASFYDPNRMMGDVLADLYGQGELAYGPVGAGPLEALARTAGACRFCVNDRWHFPQGCPYGKPDEPSPPAGFLEKVAAALVTAGPVRTAAS